MTARAALQTILSTDPVLTTGIGVEKVYASNSVDTPGERLFIVVRWEEGTKAFGLVGPDQVTVWAHTKDHDYTEIDRILERAKVLVTDAVHVPGSDGYVITTATWNGDSSDLIDGGFGTLTRNSGFTVLSRYDESYREGE